MGFFIVTSILIIFLSSLIPTEGVYAVLHTALQQIGVSAFLASTISVAFAEYYRALRNESFREEFDVLTTRLEQMLERQQEIFDIPMKKNIADAGITALFPDRKGAATEDLRSKLESVEEGTIMLLGATLRVFFHPGSDFATTIHNIILRKPKVKIRVLLLNLNSLQALYRSEAETKTSFVSDEDYRERSAQYREGEMSRMQIDILNNLIEGHRPIEARFYDTAPYCLLVMFDDLCYTTQYMFGDPSTQVTTARLPMIKYKRGSVAYEKLKWHFDFVWKNAVSYKEVSKSCNEKPVVKTYRP